MFSEEAYIPEPNTGCWLWLGHMHRGGYGQLTRNNRTLKAHRVAYEDAHGLIPDGALVCHHCDTPLCVNPEHLYVGTWQSNMDDRVKRGRWKGGRKPRVPGAPWKGGWPKGRPKNVF
jgi:hypothetical protein